MLNLNHIFTGYARGKMIIGSPLKLQVNNYKTIVYDSFNRADGISLGNADSGQVWNILSGVWGISNNQAYCYSSTGVNRTEIDSKSSDCVISATYKVIDSANNSPRLIFRATDASNEYVITPCNTYYTLNKRVNGSLSIIATMYVSCVNEDIVKVICNGNVIKVYINDTLATTVTDTFNQTATKCGLFTYQSISSRIDNFKVESL